MLLIVSSVDKIVVCLTLVLFQLEIFIFFMNKLYCIAQTSIFTTSVCVYYFLQINSIHSLSILPAFLGITTTLNLICTSFWILFTVLDINHNFEDHIVHHSLHSRCCTLLLPVPHKRFFFLSQAILNSLAIWVSPLLTAPCISVIAIALFPVDMFGYKCIQKISDLHHLNDFHTTYKTGPAPLQWHLAALLYSACSKISTT